METKGTLSNPYSQEDYEAMLDAGTWKGGYVKGLGYCMAEVVIWSSSHGSDASNSECSDSDSSWWSYSSDLLIDSSNDNPDDETTLNSTGGSDDTGETGDTGGTSGTGGAGGTGGSGGTGGTGGTDGNNSNVDNAGEADYSSLYTYTEKEANALMDRGAWKGGYVVGLGYVLPCLIVLPSSVNSPASGLQILNKALEFMNTPYKLGGCDKSGIDCSGLISAVLNIPRWTTSSGDIPGMRKITLTNHNNNFISELQKGDILVWRKNNQHRYGHVAIFVEDTKIFHAHGKTGTLTGYTHDLINHWYTERGIPEVYRK